LTGSLSPPFDVPAFAGRQIRDSFLMESKVGSMPVLEFTVQRNVGDDWTVVVEESRPDTFLLLRREGLLTLPPDACTTLTQQLTERDIDPLAYGAELGRLVYPGCSVRGRRRGAWSWRRRAAGSSRGS
jgi:hypothetical protein